MSDTIKLRNVRLSFPNLFKPKAFQEGQDAKFGATFLMDKEHHAPLIKELKTAIAQLANDYFKGKVPPMVKQKYPLRDGSEKEDLHGYGDGVLFLSASSKRRPVVVDRKVQPLAEDDGVVYPGCYVNATVRPWVQDNQFGKRVNFELRAVQFVKDGEPFGQGPVIAEEEFDALDADAEDFAGDDDDGLLS